MTILVLLCGAASADAAEPATAWCEGGDRLTVENDGFWLNGKRLPDFTVTDATEETGIFWEYDGRLFVPCAAAAAAEPQRWCTDSVYAGNEQMELVIYDDHATVNGHDLALWRVRFATIDGGQRIAIIGDTVLWRCLTPEESQGTTSQK